MLFSITARVRHFQQLHNKQGRLPVKFISFGLIFFFVACLLIGVMATFLFLNYQRNSKPPLKKNRPVPIHWGVSSGHPLATKAGMEILEQGGNAMDAAVAVAYTLSVVEPYACGLGGGGEILVYRQRDRKIRVIDYRENAPSKIDAVQRSGSVTGIPGFTAGMESLLRQYGTLSRPMLMKRAVEYAQKGFPIHRTLADLLLQYNGSKLAPFKTPDFYRNGRPLRKGDILRQPLLARKLQDIMNRGNQAFYNEALIQDLKRSRNPAGAGFTLEDLRDYRIRKIAPVKGRFCGYDVYAPPPPGGGMTLLEMLRLAEISGATHPFLADEKRALLLFQGMAIAYADRKKYLGDPYFGAEVPVWLNQTEYLRKQWRAFDHRFTIPANDEEHSTTHFVVADAQGNWVSCTQTLGDFFGSGLMHDGYFFNNSLNKFSTDLNSPNRMVPGKRPFSYMSPALLFKAGRPFLGLGTPGGRRIPAILTQMLIHHLKDGVPLQAAIDMPRYFINPGRSLFFEKLPPGNVMANFRKNGFRAVNTANFVYFGAIQALEIDPESGRLSGAADFRRGGSFSCRNLNRDAEPPAR